MCSRGAFGSYLAYKLVSALSHSVTERDSYELPHSPSKSVTPVLSVSEGFNRADNAEFELARKLNIPIDGSSK